MTTNSGADGIFEELARDPACLARTGQLRLGHGSVRTPVFMPVGTAGAVKAIRMEELAEIGFEIILANTYHLYLRPGDGRIGDAGGLHRFTGWEGNYLTDSGGFQVFSLTGFRKVTEEGVKFRSHIDGSSHMLSPEKVVEVQERLGSDIMMQLDICSPWGTERKDAVKALETTTAWGRRAKAKWLELDPEGRHLLFPIAQGAFFQDLRERSLAETLELGLPGIALGGLSVGEPPEVFAETLAGIAPLLPRELPRYVMGIGTPEYILEAVMNGVDMFDCVFPTRNARNGMLFTLDGPLSIKQERYTRDDGPIDPECGCPVCARYSRSYLRHLFKAGEIGFSMLATSHNLRFLHAFMENIRKAIAEGSFLGFRKAFLERYAGGGAGR